MLLAEIGGDVNGVAGRIALYLLLLFVNYAYDLGFGVERCRGEVREFEVVVRLFIKI